MSVKRFLNTPATWYPKSGYDKFGRDISGNGVAVNVRFENRTFTRKNKDGQVVQYLGKMFFDPSVNVQTEDRISFSASVNYKIATVNGDTDLRGNQRMIECEVEKWIQN